MIGLGGNVGTEAVIIERFRGARAALGELGGVMSAPLYRSAPIGPAQAAFLNTAVRVGIPDLPPSALIATILEIERSLGRDRAREARWGPRPIDLDVLTWGTRIVRHPELEVPHPRLAQRRFALAPLVDLLGETAVIPGIGAAGALLQAVRDQQLEQLAEHW